MYHHSLATHHIITQAFLYTTRETSKADRFNILKIIQTKLKRSQDIVTDLLPPHVVSQLMHASDGKDDHGSNVGESSSFNGADDDPEAEECPILPLVQHPVLPPILSQVQPPEIKAEGPKPAYLAGSTSGDRPLGGGAPWKPSSAFWGTANPTSRASRQLSTSQQPDVPEPSAGGA